MKKRLSALFLLVVMVLSMSVQGFAAASEMIPIDGNVMVKEVEHPTNKATVPYSVVSTTVYPASVSLLRYYDPATVLRGTSD